MAGNLENSGQLMWPGLLNRLGYFHNVNIKCE